MAWSVHNGLGVYRFRQGEPIFLMPGPHRFARPGLLMTDALINGLTGLGREVITFDPPGSGRSTRRPRLGMHEMHDCGDEAFDVTGTVGAVDAVGHSMSGLALLAYAIERPRRIKRLVLIGTGAGGYAYMTAPGALWNRSHLHFWRIALLGILHIVWPRLGPERWLNNVIHRESFVDLRRAHMNRITAGDWLRPREGRTDWHRMARRLNYAPRLGEIMAPTLIACGRRCSTAGLQLDGEPANWEPPGGSALNGSPLPQRRALAASRARKEATVEHIAIDLGSRDSQIRSPPSRTVVPAGVHFLSWV